MSVYRARPSTKTDQSKVAYLLIPLGVVMEECTMVRRIGTGIAGGLLVLALAAGSTSAANPPGTGQPGQSCQDIEGAGGTTPGHSASSPGSPFNEPSSTSNGGTGGQNYSEKSQYDVACYHNSHKPH